MKCRHILLFLVIIFIFSFSYNLAEVPQMINYQGKITTPEGYLIGDTAAVYLTMRFSIYADSEGVIDPLWTETQNSVKVEYGIFSVLLGGIYPIPDTVFTGDIRYLGVKVGADPEMMPRKPIVSTGYAYNSDMLDGMHAGNNAGNIPINNGSLNTNLNADLLDGISSEAFIPNYPINKVVRGCIWILAGSSWISDILSTEIDPNKSFVIINDSSNGLVVTSLTSSEITLKHHSNGTFGPFFVTYQIIEYK